MQVVDIPKGAVKVNKAIDTRGARKLVNYKRVDAGVQESWRRMRDFFYAPNMHGVDWDAKGAVRGVGSARESPFRPDLRYGEMIGELNVGHLLAKREHPQAEKAHMGLLGAEFSKIAERVLPGDMILEGAN